LTDKTTYVLLIYRTASGDVDERASTRALDGHRRLQADAVSHGDLHAVARLSGIECAKTVRVESDAHAITDGPFVETKEWLIGFYLVDCADENEAVERAKLIAPVAGHAIEVRPVSWRWQP
jgi:hypothetical protein